MHKRVCKCACMHTSIHPSIIPAFHATFPLVYAHISLYLSIYLPSLLAASYLSICIYVHRHKQRFVNTQLYIRTGGDSVLMPWCIFTCMCVCTCKCMYVYICSILAVPVLSLSPKTGMVRTIGLWICAPMAEHRNLMKISLLISWGLNMSQHG